MKTNNKRLITIILGVTGILCIPLLAMQFTNEVKWTGFDFAVMGVLLLSTGLIGDLILRKVKKPSYKIIGCALLLLALLLIWAELAVGIFETSIAGS